MCRDAERGEHVVVARCDTGKQHENPSCLEPRDGVAQHDHARIPELNRPVATFLRLQTPVAFDAADGMPVDLIFGLLSPEAAGAAHLHALAAISRMMRDEKLHAALGEATGAEALYALLANGIDRDAA